MEVSLPAEAVFHIKHTAITNTILLGWIVTAFILVLAFVLRSTLRKVPGRLQAGFELVYDWFLDTTELVIGRRDVAREIFPYIMSLFLFILFANWSELIPGVGPIKVHEGEHFVPLLRAPTSDLNTTLALAILTMGYIQYLGFKYAGPKAYLGKFLNFKNPMAFATGIMELISEFSRVISFSFRLFGNMLAGEILIGVMMYLTITLLPYLFILPAPFYYLEFLIGIIQAFVFSFLMIIFTSLAITAHDSEGHESGGEELHVAELAGETEDLLFKHN